MAPERLKILLVEDDQGDADYVAEILSAVKERPEIFCVDRIGAARQRLDNEHFDVVILDLSLPDSFGLDTFLKAHAHAPRIPIVVLTGSNDTQLAFDAVREGAQDYLLKEHLDGQFLFRSLHYAVERHRLVLKLQDALDHVRRLSGLLPICSRCKKIRNDGGYWQAVESYIEEHSDAELSTGICPNCLKELYPDVADEVLSNSD
jgi:DNA-binding NtrC family response regulator